MKTPNTPEEGPEEPEELMEDAAPVAVEPDAGPVERQEAQQDGSALRAQVKQAERIFYLRACFGRKPPKGW